MQAKRIDERLFLFAVLSAGFVLGCAGDPVESDPKMCIDSPGLDESDLDVLSAYAAEIARKPIAYPECTELDTMIIDDGSSDSPVKYQVTAFEEQLFNDGRAGISVNTLTTDRVASDGYHISFFANFAPRAYEHPYRTIGTVRWRDPEAEYFNHVYSYGVILDLPALAPDKPSPFNFFIDYGSYNHLIGCVYVSTRPDGV